MSDNEGFIPDDHADYETLPSDHQVRTDFAAGTLSAADRETFLNSSGIGTMDSETAARLRASWPDEDILAAMEMGAA